MINLIGCCDIEQAHIDFLSQSVFRLSEQMAKCWSHVPMAIHLLFPDVRSMQQYQGL